MEVVEFGMDLEDCEGFSSHGKDHVWGRGRCLGEGEELSMFGGVLRNFSMDQSGWRDGTGWRCQGGMVGWLHSWRTLNAKVRYLDAFSRK